MSGSTIRRKVVSGLAPSPAAARLSDQSKLVSVAVTVMTTKGVASAVCARTSPAKVPMRLKYSRDDDRHDHRQDEEAEYDGAAGQPRAAEAECRHGAEHRGQERDRKGKLQAQGQRARPARIAEEVPVPLQRQAGHRIAEVRLGVERQGNDREDGRDEEHEHQSDERPGAVVGDPFCRRGVWRRTHHQPSFTLSMPTSRL
jgi:hypothetical protein